jgi:hypothetical protein
VHFKVAITPKRISATFVSSHYASLWSVARFALRREREARTAKFLFFALSANCWCCTWSKCAAKELSTSLSRCANTSIRMGECAKCWPVMPPKLALPLRCLPHKWRHFLFTWLKKEGVDDVLIQPYSEHTTRQSLEIYSRLSLDDAQPSYNQAMERFPFSRASFGHALTRYAFFTRLYPLLAAGE